MDAVAREIQRARAKFPAPKHRVLALFEEAGEVAEALIEGRPAQAVIEEAIQVACTAIRIAEEGDADHPDVQGAREGAAYRFQGPESPPVEAPAAWIRFILHPYADHGEPGLIVLENGSTPEQCVARAKVDEGHYVLVRARPVLSSQVREGAISFHPSDIDEFLASNEDMACVKYPEFGWVRPPLAGPNLGFLKLRNAEAAVEAFRAMYIAWFRAHVEVMAYELHPEDHHLLELMVH